MAICGERNWRSGLLGVFSIIGVLAHVIFCSENQALAQITPDGTLGDNSSKITPNVNIKELPADRIDGGATRGANLFHSFQDFNVSELQRVYFANPTGIENILTRVTGSNISKILGTLGVDGGANLFFLNPNGILFGNNARLDVAGSFVASTANSFVFGDGLEFSATNPQTPSPLLTVNPSALFFNQLQAGRIENRSVAPAGDNLFGLRVPDGRSLILVGGDIAIDRGGLNAPGGRVELAGVTGDTTTVGLNVDANNLSLSFPEDLAKADISLTNQAFVNTSGEGGGSIQVHGRNVTLNNKSFMFADTLGSQNGSGVFIKALQLMLEGESLVTAVVVGSGQGGNITIEAEQLQLKDGAQILAGTFGEGNGGSLKVNASESVQLIGLASGSSSGLFSLTGGAGNAGNINISTKQLTIENGGQIGARTFAEGKAGNIDISTERLLARNARPYAIAANALGTGDAGNITIETVTMNVINSQVGSIVFRKGKAGNLTVRAAESVEVSGKIKLFRLNIENPAGLFAQVNVTGEGRGGNLTIETKRLSVSNGGKVQVATFGQGDAGNLTIRASEVEVFDTPLGNLFATGINAGIERDPDETVIPPRGNGGDLTIETDRLSVRNGAIISVGTAGQGNAGRLRIRASDSVEVVGKSPNGNFKSQVSAAVTPEGTGTGGSLKLETGQMIIRDGAEVTVSSTGLGTAGNLEIQARSINLDNQAAIIATTRSGNGGDMTLNLQELLLLRNGSQISTTSGNNEFGGDGGNITINTPFIVAVRKENSDISANAFAGKGGRVNITANGIFGIVPQKRPTQKSDITASSQLGVSGEVTINTPDTDPARGLVQLPSNLVDASQQIASGCTPGGRQTASRFIATGRGGLPLSPNEPLRGRAVITDWVDLPPQVTQRVTDK